MAGRMSGGAFAARTLLCHRDERRASNSVVLQVRPTLKQIRRWTQIVVRSTHTCVKGCFTPTVRVLRNHYPMQHATITGDSVLANTKVADVQCVAKSSRLHACLQAILEEALFLSLPTVPSPLCRLWSDTPTGTWPISRLARIDLLSRNRLDQK